MSRRKPLRHKRFRASAGGLLPTSREFRAEREEAPGSVMNRHYLHSWITCYCLPYGVRFDQLVGGQTKECRQLNPARSMRTEG